MAPQTRSIASKRNNLSITDQLEDDGNFNKRQKRVQSPFPPSKSRYSSRFLSGEILPGRFVDLQFFNREGFQFGKWFEDSNWLSILGMKQKFYPELVRQFYANLSYDANRTEINSVVKGKKIRLDQNKLNKIVGIPNLGTEVLYDMNNWGVDDNVGVSRLEALRLIHDNPDLTEVVSKVNSCHLKLEMRLLHQMVVHIILPRKRSLNYVSDLDLLVMWHIVKEKPFNLPFVMLSHIISCSENKNAYFPYGMVLTSIFEHYKVSLEDEESKELKGCSVYNEATLHKMGYVKIGKGWCLKKDKAVVAHDPSSETESVAIMNVGEAQNVSVASSDSDSHEATEGGDKTSIAVPNSASSAAQCPDFALTAEYLLRPAWGDRQASLITGIFLVLEGMKEDMRTVNTSTGHLRVLVTKLRNQWHRKKTGDVFLLLEVIIGDMRTSRGKMDRFGSKVECLLSQLTEFLNLREDWEKDETDNIEWMITEAGHLRRQNRDLIQIYETIRSEIQDMWDSLSCRM